MIAKQAFTNKLKNYRRLRQNLGLNTPIPPTSAHPCLLMFPYMSSCPKDLSLIRQQHHKIQSSYAELLVTRRGQQMYRVIPFCTCGLLYNDTPHRTDLVVEGVRNILGRESDHMRLTFMTFFIHAIHAKGYLP